MSAAATCLGAPREIPTVRGRPLVGSLADRQRLGAAFYAAMARQHGDAVRFRLATHELVLLSHPDLVHTVVRDHASRYGKGRMFATLRALLGNGLFFAEGADWRRQRRVVAPTFHPTHLRALLPIVAQCVDDALPAFDDAARRGTALDLHAAMGALALDIAARTLFGAAVDPGIRDRIGALVQELSHLVDARMFSLLGGLPLWVPTRVNRASRAAIAELDGLLYAVIDARRADRGAQDPRDLLGSLLAARDAGAPLGRDALRDQGMTFLMAGHETTASALSWCWKLLADHPDVQEQVAAEVVGAQPADADDPQRLPLTRAVLQEALRLYPPGWTFVREALEDDVVGGYAVPKGTNVIVCPLAMHRDPRFFAEPDAFRPQRFPLDPLSRRAYLPFGAGPRACIGGRFATTTAVAALAALLQRYRFAPAPGPAIQLDPLVTLRPRPGVPVRVSLRSHASVAPECAPTDLIHGGSVQAVIPAPTRPETFDRARLVAVRRAVAARDPDALRALHRLRPAYGLKALVFVALWATGIAASLSSPWLWVPGWAVSTAGLLGLAILVHEGAHRLLSRNAAINRWFAFACGAPALVSATAYRINHTTHHAVTGTDEDPADLVASSARSGIPFGRLVGIVLTLGTVLVLPDIARGGWRKADAAGRRQIATEYALIAGLVAVAVALVPVAWLVHGWVVPFFFGALANNLRSLAEHTLTDRTDPLRNSRTVPSRWWVRFVQSNVNFHWEHHLFPSVPWYNLPELRALLAPERRRYRPPEADTYLGWLWDEVLPAMRGQLALHGRWTLVTGASSGLGEHIARTIARDHGGNLVLVARRGERLARLATELREQHGVDVATIVADLSDPEDSQRAWTEATTARELRAIVLNAGVASLGRVTEQPFAQVDAMLATNVRSTAWLAQRAVADLASRNEQGGVLIVSSLAGISPTPYLAAYSGTKAFLVHFGLALAEEVRRSSISVTVFAPGGIATEMGHKSGTARKFKRGDAVLMEADLCAAAAVRALVARRRLAVPGWLNRLAAVAVRLAPPTVCTAVNERIYRGALAPRSA